ncbi:uncharacterized protein EHS24_007654 [Apiotrichum porosum]|uniref:Metallo-beta-lactamase domain-containing protein n=1 Tax=Apiotrichum porosum TaxID=105984 RepID=A0A427XUZ4_9TREE|nr:uncharacterized protein EHS24_007654 [Apiotrichum porosum]RSH82660.1 hypothetical protein EHS24_007654 [Apiotrichum porosum]
MTSYSSLPEGSTDPRDANLVIRELLPGMITFSQPFVSVTLAHHCGVPSISNIAQSRFGVVPIGGRSTAIRVNDGIFVYVSHPYTTATAEALKQLGGEVKWLVTPDGEHGMNIGAWAEQFPEAKAIGVSRFEKAKPNVKWAGLFGAGGEDKTYGFEPEISLHQVSAHVNDELTAIHHPSGTLLEADLLFNLPPKEQYSRAGGLTFFSRLLGGSFSPDGSLHKSAIGSLVAKPDLAKKELAPIFAAKWDRLVPCHGDVIETGGKEAWTKLYGQFHTPATPPADDPAKL